MNVDEALRRLGDGERFPREAMEWALGAWEQAAPRLVARLRALAAGAEWTETAENQAFCIVHLCGQMRETRAYEPLCRLLAEDPETESWLGDAMTESLPGILIATFDGDVAPLKAVVEAEGADPYARGAALIALGYLVRARGALDDAAMAAYLSRVRKEARPRDLEGFWFVWAQTAAALGYDELKMELAILTKEGLIEAADFGVADFDRAAERGREDPEGLAGFHAQGVRPLDDAVAQLESWNWSRDDGLGPDDPESAWGDDGPGFDEPYVNPLRDVGRNDPCPCGSGKKFKKCCLISAPPPGGFARG